MLLGGPWGQPQDPGTQRIDTGGHWAGRERWPQDPGTQRIGTGGHWAGCEIQGCKKLAWMATVRAVVDGDPRVQGASKWPNALAVRAHSV